MSEAFTGLRRGAGRACARRTRAQNPEDRNPNGERTFGEERYGMVLQGSQKKRIPNRHWTTVWGLSTCFVMALASGGCVSRARLPVVPPPVAQPETPVVALPFRVGERLTYDVYYGLIHAGTAVLSVQGIEEVCGRQTYHIVFTGKTSPGFSKIFSVDDRVETFIDVQELIPWKFAKSLREGDYKHDEETILDQENHLGHYCSKRSGYTKDYELPEKCQDSLSVFYFCRLLSYRVGEKFSLKAMADEEIMDVEVEVEERVNRTIYRGGSYDAFLLISDVNFDAGTLSKGKGRLWITADDRKLIVLLKTKLTFGYLTFALVGVASTYEDIVEGEKRASAGEAG
jgi:hypothetical protein